MKRSVASVVAAAVFAVLASASPSSASSARRIVRVPLSAVPDGVSARTLGGTPVFLVRQGESVTTFLTDPHGTPGLHILWWCPNEQVFIEPAHAEAFDMHGRIVGGPPSRGLDRLKTTVKDRTVVIRADIVMRGGTARYDPLGRNDGSYEYIGVYATWNSGPGSFCNQPIIGGRT
jgi:hypothetical protein